MFIQPKCIWLLLIAAMLGCFPVGLFAAEPVPPDPHAGHDHDHGHDHAQPAPPVQAPPTELDHTGHDHADHAAATAANPTVHLSPAGLKAADLLIEKVGAGVIRQGWDTPGEIHFNGDGLAKIGARVPGQVVTVHVTTGATVAKGDLLAVLQSTELGNAKIDYYSAQANLDLAQKEHSRAQLMLEQTRLLIQTLDQAVTVEAADRTIQAIRIGEVKATVVNARSAWQLAQAVAARTVQLKVDNLVSMAEVETRNQEAESARVRYKGACDEAELRGEIAVQQAEGALRLADLACQNAERRLHIIGFSDAQVAKLPVENDEVVARYEIRAPAAGTVIRRDLAVGQKINDDHTAFLLADTATVWCFLQVSSHRLAEVRTGQRLLITGAGLADPIEATIADILPSIDEHSRTGTARAVLANPNGLLKPGLFVTVRIETSRIDTPLAVRAAALQSIDNQPVVFVASDDGDEFSARAVTVGRRDGTWVEILSGLQAGEAVVVRNAFVLKAELGKAGAKHEH